MNFCHPVCEKSDCLELQAITNNNKIVDFNIFTTLSV